MELTDTEIRVLACLLEKQRTTPDVYPLTLNALRLACNQSTNRDPVVQYDEETIREALRRLQRHGLARFTSGHGSRSSKYRHLLEEALPMSSDEQALICVLMLRGIQTPGELKQRAERMHAFADLGALQETLEKLIKRELVVRLERRPGQKEERYKQLLGGDAPQSEGGVGQQSDTAVGVESPEQRFVEERSSEPALQELERRVAQLEQQVSRFAEMLDVDAGSPAQTMGDPVR